MGQETSLTYEDVFFAMTPDEINVANAALDEYNRQLKRTRRRNKP